jgi:hypothetical protein
MSVKERIVMFIKYLNMGQTAFEKSCGLSNGLVNNIKGSISEKSLQKISQKYPDLNTTWLMMGDGQMLRNTHQIQNASVRSIQQFVNVPIVQVRAVAGYLHGYGDHEYIDSLPTIPAITDKSYRGKYLCFECDGDSMDDGSRYSVCDKDILLGREVKRDLWKYKLHINDWFFIIVHVNGINVKKITHHDLERGTIRCHSLNPLYEDFELSLNDVYELYNVIKIVDRTVRL